LYHVTVPYVPLQPHVQNNTKNHRNITQSNPTQYAQTYIKTITKSTVPPISYAQNDTTQRYQPSRKPHYFDKTITGQCNNIPLSHNKNKTMRYKFSPYLCSHAPFIKSFVTFCFTVEAKSAGTDGTDGTAVKINTKIFSGQG